MSVDRRRSGSESDSNSNNKVIAWIVSSGAVLSLSGLIILAVGAVLLLAVPDLETAGKVLIVLSGLMITVSTLTHLSEVKNAVIARTGRYAINTLVMVFAFGAILMLLGYISLQNSVRIDLTATKQFTLAPQTLKVLKELKKPVQATVYSDPEQVSQEQIRMQADNFFFEFNKRNKDFTFEFVDPDLKPSLARRDGVKGYPSIVFKVPDSESNPHILTPTSFGETLVLSEQDLVSALLISTGQKQKIVYMLTGHGEKHIDDSDIESEGFGLARAGLVGDNYIVKSLNLKQSESVPDDAAVLIVAGPSSSILMDEREKIEAYLEDSGRAMFLIDDAASSQMNQLLNKWGIHLPKGTIIDESSSANSDPRSPIVRRANYIEGHQITEPLDDTFFIEATGIVDVIERAPEGLPPNPDEINITHIPLAATSLVSCISMKQDDMDCSDPAVLNGPFPIAMAIESVAMVGQKAPRVDIGEEIPTTHIIVFGDSDFASKKYYRSLNNGDFFLNSVDWLTKNYDLISIRAKPHAFRQLVIDPKEFDFIRYSSWFLVPSGIIMLAVIAWWRRR